MRLLKESVLQIWKAQKAAVRDELANAERAANAIQDKLDRLDEASLFERSIDIETYDRHVEKRREELPLARIDRHSGQLDELDVEGILAFAERVLPRAADLWVRGHVAAVCRADSQIRFVETSSSQSLRTVTKTSRAVTRS